MSYKKTKTYLFITKFSTFLLKGAAPHQTDFTHDKSYLSSFGVLARNTANGGANQRAVILLSWMTFRKRSSSNLFRTIIFVLLHILAIPVFKPYPWKKGIIAMETSELLWKRGSLKRLRICWVLKWGDFEIIYSKNFKFPLTTKFRFQMKIYVQIS